MTAAERKYAVGFGPATTANSFHQSGVKVSAELEKDPCFRSGIFKEPFDLNELMAYDALVFIKIIPSYEILRKLKDAGKTLILDYQDMFLYPSVYERDPVRKLLKKIYYFRLESGEKRRLRLLDRCLVASPAAQAIVNESGVRPFFLERQIYNDRSREIRKVYNEKTNGLKLYWTGVALNLDENEPISAALKRLCEKYSSKVVFHTQGKGMGSSHIEYREWKLDGWEEEMAGADIAFRWWRDSNSQFQKDSNKVISYMAAGLPIVCRPTVSDRRIIEHGSNGFFADMPEEFETQMERLVLDPGLRKRAGEAAFRESWANYSISSHVGKLKGLLLEISGARPAVCAI